MHSVSQTEATKGNDTAQPVKFNVGQSVIVDSKYFGEVTKDLLRGFYEVEVDADKPRHETWTVRAGRLEPNV